MTDSRPKVMAVLLAAVLVAGAAPAAAELCSVDQAPGATVLLPYFEVDLPNPSGLTTLFELVNARPEPALARVTLWTDLAVPTYAFDVYLTGFDVQSFNLRDLFAGRPPVTGTELTPDGRFSLPSAPFPGCDGSLAPAVPVDHLRAAHRGLPSALLGGQCAGLRWDDTLARGYLTADVVGECGSGLFPSDPGYFGPGGVARFDNVLWGDYVYVDPVANVAQSDSLVRLEADPEAFGPGDRTFYGRYLGGSGADAREPLPSAWGVRTLRVGGRPEDGSAVVSWRETPGPPLPFPCGGFPEWFPLPVSQLLIFDEEENGSDPRQWPVSPPIFIQTAAASRELTAFALESGWLYVDLDVSAAEPAQGYLASQLGAEGRYSLAVGGTPMGPGCGAQGCDLGVDVAATKLCLFGSFEGDTTLGAGEPVVTVVTAGGCHSLSCVGLAQVACAVRSTGLRWPVGPTRGFWTKRRSRPASISRTATCSGSASSISRDSRRHSVSRPPTRARPTSRRAGLPVPWPAGPSR